MNHLLAVSDLHVDRAENRPVVNGIRPCCADDWLVVAGDVADRFEAIVDALAALKSRFETVIWVPGNHDLWTLAGDEKYGEGEARYLALVGALRELGVVTPEDPYLAWPGSTDPVVIAPLFVLYDYTFRPVGASTREEAMAAATAAGVVCADEAVLQPDPYVDLAAWCDARVEYTRARLEQLDAGTRTVLINHWPLVREPTRVLWYPEFALWCGTERTADWPERYRAAAVIYGHLHIPRTMTIAGVAHHEVSLGYPREWTARARPPRLPVRILIEPNEF